MERTGFGGCGEICLDHRQGKHFFLVPLEHLIHILILNKTVTIPKKRYPHHNVLIQLTTTSHDPKAHTPIAVVGAVVKPGSASNGGDSSRFAIANGNSGGSNNGGGVVAGVLVTSSVISTDNNNDNNTSNNNNNNNNDNDPLDMMMTIEEPREVVLSFHPSSINCYHLLLSTYSFNRIINSLAFLLHHQYTNLFFSSS